MEFEFKSRYTIDDLLEIMKILRSENGCPWDKVQTHESIRTDLIEEAYEVCEGIDANSPEMLREELGDLLMQVVFHSQIETERGSFDFGDVCNDICQKLIYRHPHVFGTVKADTEDEVLRNWDALKKKSKNQDTATETLESVPKTFPSLLRGEKICRRAERAGLPINGAGEFIERIKRALDELEISDFDEKIAQNQQILGYILLCFCNLDRILKTDGEKALTYSINRFIMGFRVAENDALRNGGSLDKLSDGELSRIAESLFSTGL
ncbi:MAG: nucleoside triphosphate pyrophosphohydrolase [Lachnospiraceae bacterium]|nr:nucleoside triphosphate pyrophosphohydrolase [Ruminococcus sp.]MCM1274093.1 nucleoside triphosphate pyrophosphohydrolase [Lachnospiraceae bacterium]